MVDMAHNGNDRRATHEVLRLFSEPNIMRALLFVTDLVGGCTKFTREFFSQSDIESLVNGGEDLFLYEFLDDQVCLDAKLLGKLFYRDAFGNGNLAVNGRWLEHRGALGPALSQIPFFVILTFPNARPQTRLGLMTPLLFGGQRRRSLGPQRSRRVHGPQTRPALPRQYGSARNSRAPHDGLAGTNRAAIYRLARSRRRPRGSRWHGASLLQTLH